MILNLLLCPPQTTGPVHPQWKSATKTTKIQLNPDNSNLQGKSKKVRVIGVRISKRGGEGNRKRFELAEGSSY